MLGGEPASDTDATAAAVSHRRAARADPRPAGAPKPSPEEAAERQRLHEERVREHNQRVDAETEHCAECGTRKYKNPNPGADVPRLVCVDCSGRKR